MTASRLVRETFTEFGKDDCSMMAASLSFYTIFSLPPLLFITVMAAGSFFGREAVETHILEQTREFIGPAASAQINTMLQQAGDRISEGGLSLLVSIGALLFAATAVLVQLQTALNRAWEVRPDPDAGGLKNFLTKRLISLAALLAVAFLMLVSLVLSAAVSAVGGAVFGLLPGQISNTALHGLQLAATVALFTVVFAGILRFLPDAEINWADVWVGAFVTAVLITAGKFALGVYLGTSDVGQKFGAAGSLAVIMLWVYYASMILLFGAEFTQVWTRFRGNSVRPEPGAVRFNYEPAQLGGAPAQQG